MIRFAPLVLVTAESDPGEQGIRHGDGIGPVVDEHGHLHILPSREGAEQVVLLEDKTDLAPGGAVA